MDVDFGGVGNYGGVYMYPSLFVKIHFICTLKTKHNKNITIWKFDIERGVGADMTSSCRFLSTTPPIEQRIETE